MLFEIFLKRVPFCHHSIAKLSGMFRLHRFMNERGNNQQPSRMSKRIDQRFQPFRRIFDYGGTIHDQPMTSPSWSVSNTTPRAGVRTSMATMPRLST